MWFSSLFKPKKKESRVPLYFHNTLGNEKQWFLPAPHAKEVRMYNCGPTVYGRQHIGNLSMFVFTDLLRRTLEWNGFTVKQVINFTDFGHLSSDADEGDDKMTLGLKREGLKPTLENMRALGEKYANLFLEDIRLLNVKVDKITFPRASDYIPAQIAMIEALEEKGYAYETKYGIYFDTSKFPDYGKLGDINIEGLQKGARLPWHKSKRNVTDFVLWKKDPKLGWDSQRWGKGFPGWHIECSAMIRSTLGTQIDIHTGGIEHIPVHHNNEIAQSESATGKKPLARFWLHRAHLQFEGARLAKSTGNVVYLTDIIERGFHPLSFRYLLLGAHYRTNANFTWEALGAAQAAFGKLLALRLSHADVTPGAVSQHWGVQLMQCINDDLNTPGALAILWEVTKDGSLSPADLLATLFYADTVFGLQLEEPDGEARKLAAKYTQQEVVDSDLPAEIQAFLKERDAARREKNWQRADELRTLIEAAGYTVEDKSGTTRVLKQ